MAGSGWKSLPFNQAVQINPSVPLVKGQIYPFVDMQAIDSTSRTVGPSEFREFKGGGSRFSLGDTLMARITPCLENGKIARFRGQANETVAHGSTEFIVIRGREGITDNDYAYYLTRWDGVRGYAISQMTGSSGRQRVPTDSFEHLDISLPPLPEQRVVAHVLGTLDDKIELNRRMNDTLEAMARALFQSWFVDFDPVRGKGWREGKVEDIATLSRETINPGYFPEESFDHYSIPAFDEGRLPKAEKGEQIKSNKFVVLPDAVLLSKLNPRIPRVWLPSTNTGRRSLSSTEFIVAVPSKDVSPEYLFGLFSSTNFLVEFSTLVTGTSGSHQRVKPEYLLEMNTMIPPTEMILRYTALVRPLYRRVSMNLEDSNTLAGLRDVLLPKLISGEIKPSVFYDSTI